MYKELPIEYMKLIFLPIMKEILFICFVGAIYFFSPHTVEGQNFENPGDRYVPMKLDYINRGSFNMSGCLNDIINCWEIIRGDVICSHGKYFETVCGLSREYCQDVLGDYDTYLAYYEFTLYEAVCKNRWDDYYT